MAEARGVLRRTLLEAGALVRRLAGRVGYREKGRGNLVTVADHRSEALILRRLLGAFPDHGFVTEERPGRPGRSSWRWVIDPLDGTVNFAHACPVASVSVALLDGERPVLGGVYDPFRDELFLAERGKGATLNGRPIRVSRTARLSDALLVTGFAYDRARRARYYLRFYEAFLERAHDIRRTGSAALDLCWTACGRFDGFWEFSLAPWDVAAGRLVVEEAGGKVTGFDGRPWASLEESGRRTLASNGRLHAPMAGVIRRLL